MVGGHEATIRKAEIFREIFEECLSHLSLRPLGERMTDGASFQVVESSANQTIAKGQNPWLGIVVRNDSIEYRDVPMYVRDGVISFRALTLREFLERFVRMERKYEGRMPEQYLWIFRIANILNRWTKPERNAFGVIIERLQQTRDPAIRLKLYEFLNSERVRLVCRELGMPNERPNAEYTGEFARPVRLPPMKEVRGWLFEALISLGRRPSNVDQIL